MFINITDKQIILKSRYNENQLFSTRKEFIIMKRVLWTLWLCLLCLGITWAAEAPTRIYEKVGNMTFEYTPKKGVVLNVHGATALKGSALWAVKPNFIGQFYGNQNNPDLLLSSKVVSYKGGKKITLVHKNSKGNQSFHGVETFILLPDNTYTNSLEYVWTSDVPASIEWTMGEFNPYLILNQTYSAITNGNQTIKGNISMKPMGVTYDESKVARDFKEISLNSKLGPIKLTANPKDKLIMFDYRGNRWADENNPFFWLGALERPLIKNKKETLSITISFPKKINPQAKISEPVILKTEPQIIKDALTPWRDRNYIIPTPKSLQWTDASIPLNKSIDLYLGKKVTADTLKAVNFLVKDLSVRYGITVKVIQQEAPINVQGAIIAGVNTVYPRATRVCTEAGVSLPDNPEGYCLYTDGKNTYVAASTEQGLYYGFTSLVQTVKITPNQMAFKGVKIQDYPAMPFRGVHCLSAKNGGDEISKGVRDLMARFKMNNMVWECEYIIWDGHKELEHPEYGMTKNEARKVIKTAQENFIEITPLVQSLGHSAWIFQNGHNMDLAEDPDKPYAYMVTNPRTYDFIFSVYQEALDLFHPKYFHIGHDEVNTDAGARYPYRSKASGLSETELIMGDINKLHAWFKERNVRVMMWGDMFLHLSEAPDAAFASSTTEAKERRDLLPKDIFITDWHYVADKASSYPSLKTWKDAGFDVVGAGWYRPENIRTHAAAAARYGVNGYLQTTWAGFNFKINNNREAWHQYWAYILAAEYAWSGDSTELDKLPFEAKQVFLEYWFDHYPRKQDAPGFQINLSSQFNRNLKASGPQQGWVGFDPYDDMASFPTGKAMFNECTFDLTRKDTGEGALVLYSTFNPAGSYPVSAIIDLKPQSAEEVHFLLNASFRAREGAQVGSIKVHYTDGSSVTQPLVYGTQIFSFNDLRNSDIASIAWKGKNSKGNPVAVWDFVWKNPNPDKLIKSMELISNKTETSPIFYAITGVR